MCFEYGRAAHGIEAIRAKFSKSEIVNCVPWDALLSNSHQAKETRYVSRYMQNIPSQVHVAHPCHDCWSIPIRWQVHHLSPHRSAQAAAKLNITHRLSSPWFDAWAGYRITQDRVPCLSVRTAPPEILTCSARFRHDGLTRIITGGIEQG